MHRQQREFIITHYKQGMTLREIAELFKMPLSTVHVAIPKEIMRPPYVVPKRRRKANRKLKRKDP